MAFVTAVGSGFRCSSTGVPITTDHILMLS